MDIENKTNQALTETASQNPIKPSQTQSQNHIDKVEVEVEEDKDKWSFLEHNGVLFPKPYVSKGISIKYQGKPIPLDSY